MDAYLANHYPYNTDRQKGGVFTNKKIIKKTLRVTPKEAAIIAKNAAELGVSENQYLKILLQTKPNDFPELRNLIQELINETNHIGVNINQITRNQNAGYYSESETELLQAYLRRLLLYAGKVVAKLVNY